MLGTSSKWPWKPPNPRDTGKKETQVAQGKEPNASYHQYAILAIIEARNALEERTGAPIQEFAEKIGAFFDYVRQSPEGQRLIVKMKSSVSDDEIYDTLARIYRMYRALNREIVGEDFFRESEDIINRLCDDFEKTVLTEA